MQETAVADPLAFFITWTTYGSWLHGDAPGWVAKGVGGIQAPDAQKREEARARMKDEPVVLNAQQGAIVEKTIREHCEFRGWQLHAVNVRTNHVHVVVTADRAPEEVMNQFKAWCSRRLNEAEGGAGKRWWTKHGSTKWINDTAYLHNAVRYVVEGQSVPARSASDE
jgi:REP element-mobilizing transposase RayT